MAFPSYNFPIFGKELATTEQENSGRNNNETINETFNEQLNHSSNSQESTNNTKETDEAQLNRNTPQRSVGGENNGQNEEIKQQVETQKNQLNDSIRSIESDHTNYNVFSYVKNLQNTKLNDTVVYEDKINEFAQTLIINTKMNHIYHLTFSQLIEKDLRNVKTDGEYFKLIKEIINSNETLKKHKITELKVLRNQANITIKRILVAYIVYQYFAVNGLQAIDTVTTRIKEAIMKLHRRNGAMKYCLDATKIVQQSFAVFLGEQKQSGHELIKYQSSKTKLAKASYQNLEKQRARFRNKLHPRIQAPAELLYGKSRTQVVFDKIQQESRKKKNEPRKQVKHEKEDNMKKGEWKHEQVMEMNKQQNKESTEESSFQNFTLEPNWYENIKKEPVVEYQWEKIKENIDPNTGENVSEKRKLKSTKIPMAPIQEYENKENIQSPIVNVTTKITEPQHEEYYQYEFEQKYQQEPETREEYYQKQMIKKRLWREYGKNKHKIERQWQPLEFYKRTWYQLEEYLIKYLNPTHIEAIVIRDSTTWLRLYRKYAELIVEIEKQMIHVLYNLYCRYNSYHAKKRVNELTIEMMNQTGKTKEEINKYIRLYYAKYLKYDTYNKETIFEYKIYLTPISKQEKQDIKYQHRYSIATKPLTYKQASKNTQ